MLQQLSSVYGLGRKKTHEWLYQCRIINGYKTRGVKQDEARRWDAREDRAKDVAGRIEVSGPQ